MHTATALRLARSLLDAHGLREWTVALDRAKTRAGATHFRSRRITLSGPLTRAHEEDLVRDTILHEIAHALVGPSHGHDRVWKAKAREIGASDERCFSSEAARELAPFIGTCSNGHEVRRHRRPTRLIACAECSASFDPAHLFSWTYRGRGFTEHADYVRAKAGVGSAGGRANAPREARHALLELGTLARIVADGRFHGRTGEIEGVGRTRYQVRVSEGVLSVPFDFVEPA